MIDFKQFIDDSIKANPIESRILRKVIRAFKEAGNPIVSVWDGEEDNPVRTERDIFEQVFNLDWAHLYTKSGDWVFFVNGNEWDAISDYTLDIESILEPVNEWIDRNN